MSNKFFSVTHNSFDTRGFPWVQTIVNGLQHFPPCSECGEDSHRPVGDLQVLLELNKASKWPDVLGCGHHPLLIVSGRVLEDWKRDGVGDFPHHRVEFIHPLPERLGDTQPPAYYWIDGANMAGAKLDFDASGFVGVQFCKTCGRRWDDIPKTYDKQHSAVWPYTFVAGSWNGANLFTTDLSPAAFFCTNLLFECAARHQHTNFRFIPVEQGDATSSRGLDYLKRQN